jgi:homoserine O-succinyltransferase/O-acetyltransferase
VAVRLSRTGAAGAKVAGRGESPARWVCAFVNNMPDSAFLATERQFTDLLMAGSGSETVELRRYTMEGVPRGERTEPLIAEGYSGLDQLRQDPPPDLLIVTGSEPLAPAIEDEPYWDDLRDLLTWGQENVASMLLSCLAAHAALLVFDGLTRTQLPAKCTGVFRQEVERGHRLVSCVGREVVLPHSRLNTVPLDSVQAAGYEVALSSELTDWAVASKVIDRSEVVVVQGHPEYGPRSLLLEYQRDVRRYVNREREGLPVLPLHCVSDQDWGDLQQLQARLLRGERDPALLETFSFSDALSRTDWRWRDTAVTIYTNWMAGIKPISK